VRRVWALFACGAIGACSVDTVPAALRATPAGSGPAVVFDLAHQPLPDVPAPNDIATFADPTSRTGRRVNASLVAPTSMEAAARAQFDEMEGWGTSAPITVRFAPEAGGDPHAAAIDSWQMEGVSRMGRTPGSACGVDYVSSATCNMPPTTDAATCQDTLFDADWLGESRQDYGQQHLATPLRLARLAGTRVVDGASLASAWAPRTQGACLTSITNSL
jgi:hypothetical protein